MWLQSDSAQGAAEDTVYNVINPLRKSISFVCFQILWSHYIFIYIYINICTTWQTTSQVTVIRTAHEVIPVPQGRCCKLHMLHLYKLYRQGRVNLFPARLWDGHLLLSSFQKLLRSIQPSPGKKSWQTQCQVSLSDTSSVMYCNLKSLSRIVLQKSS